MSDNEFLMSDIKLEHWTKEGNKIYGSPNKSVAKLPNGAYSIGVDQFGRTFLISETISDEVIIQGCSDTFEKINDNVEQFWKSEKDYRKHNLPHKRGILLYGDPGTGKSVILRQLIKNHVANRGIAILTKDDDCVTQALKFINQADKTIKTLIVLEDIDDLIDNYGDQRLCDLLDGSKSSLVSYLFIATTNHVHRIPGRLLNRPSRLDVVVQVPPPTVKSIAAYFRTLYPSFSDRKVKEISNKLRGYSFAHVKEVGLAMTLYNQNIDTILGRFEATTKLVQKSTKKALDE